MRDVHWKEQGLYQCAAVLAQNDVVSSVSASFVVLSPPVNVSVASEPKIVAPPRNQTARVGGKAHFYCPVQACLLIHH